MSDNKKKKKEKVSNAPEPKATNLYDVLIKALDVGYNLANTGNAVGLVLLTICITFLMIVYKTPPDRVPELMKLILEFNYTYALFLGLALSISLSANFYQRTVYHVHIESLTKRRDELIYGLKSGEYSKLTDQQSSGINVKETDDDC